MAEKSKKEIIYRRSQKGLKPVTSLAHKICQKSFHKRGFNGIELFKQWEYIVGEHLNQYCRPLKIVWPREQNYMDDHLNGATLQVKCLGAFALEIEANHVTIIERVNVIFGYRAVGRLKIIQSQDCLFLKEKDDYTAPTPSANLVKQTQDVKNEALRDALNALGAQIERKNGR